MRLKLNHMKRYYILPFIVILTFSCSDNSEAELKKQKAIKQKIQKKLNLKQERLLLESEKLKLEAERKASEDQLKREELVQIAKLERNFPRYTSAVVINNKAYFHSKPNKESASGRKYLIAGDVCSVVTTKGGFGYIDYYNERRNKTTSGWIDLQDLEPFYDEEYGD